MTKRIISGICLIFLCAAGIFTSTLLWNGADTGVFMLTGLFIANLLIGLINPDMMRIAVALAILPASRIVSLTLAPDNGQIQTIILSGSLFTLGLSYTLRIPHRPFHFPKRLHFLSGLGICIVAAGYGFIAASVRPGFAAGGENHLYMALTLLLLSVSCELVFRSALLGTLVRQFHPALAMLMCILTEASLYTNSSTIQYFIVCIAGVIASYIYLREGKLWQAVLFSFIWRYTYYYIYAAGIITIPFISPV